MATSFSDSYKIDYQVYEVLGALDPILGIDTRLFIDPLLVKNTKIPEFQEAGIKIEKYFESILTLLKACQKEKDIFWNQAVGLFKSSEISGLSIGYGKDTDGGGGIGKIKKLEILKNLKQILDAGTDDPAIFELIGGFQDGIGPDLISDLISNILINDLVAYTQRICSELNIPLVELSFSKNYKPEKLPKNILNGKPIILVPKEFLRDLPIADSFMDIDWICKHNDELRRYLNSVIEGSFKKITIKEQKGHIRKAIIDDPDFLKEILEAYRNQPPKYYDFLDDPKGETIWYEVSKNYVKEYPLFLQLSNQPTIDDIYSTVEKICENFKVLIEDNQLCKLLYDRDGRRKPESAAQLLFFGIANAYCLANNIDLSPESDAGRGPVDFKFSNGANCKVLVEVKLTSNSKLKKGFESQLPIYQKAEKSQKGIYLVIHNMEISDKRWKDFLELTQNSGLSNLKMIDVDAIPKPSASVADE
ncbi:hypothetical protein [Acinetobacter vivianii]|uniref:hypothetical protein n=1 Tax=Acinetobacter vivianii TaxID=1776742 RepID=UPI003D00ED85